MSEVDCDLDIVSDSYYYILVLHVCMFYQRERDDEAEQPECLLVGSEKPYPGDHSLVLISTICLLREAVLVLLLAQP